MHIVVAGLGLIGGSFYKAAIKAGHCVTGLHHGEDLPPSMTGASTEEPGIVLVCLPPEAIEPWIVAHHTQFMPGTMVVDICGVKRPIARAVRGLVQDQPWFFVGGHPMAGREVSGFIHSKEDLFVGASMILTPFEGTPDAVLSTLKSFFASVGFHETVITTPEKHDDMIAFTSQLCHIIATTYARDSRVKESIGFSAGSYANMTRIATQDAETWSALYQSNRDALVGVLDDFAARFKQMRDAVAAGDVATMKALIDEGTKAKRQELLDRQRGDEHV